MSDASGTVILFDSEDSVGQGKAKGNVFRPSLNPLNWIDFGVDLVIIID